VTIQHACQTQAGSTDASTRPELSAAEGGELELTYEACPSEGEPRRASTLSNAASVFFIPMPCRIG